MAEAFDETQLRAIADAALAYVQSDPPRPEWRTLCDALGVDWQAGRLGTAVKALLDAWDGENTQELNDLSDDLWTAVAGLRKAYGG